MKINYLNYENMFSHVQIMSRNFLVVNKTHSFGAVSIQSRWSQFDHVIIIEFFGGVIIKD